MFFEKRDIVDTHFHASRRPGQTTPNSLVFLLHEGKDRRGKPEMGRLSKFSTGITHIEVEHQCVQTCWSSTPRAGTASWSWTE